MHSVISAIALQQLRDMEELQRSFGRSGSRHRRVPRPETAPGPRGFGYTLRRLAFPARPPVMIVNSLPRKSVSDRS